MMSSVRTKLTLANGALIGLLLLGAPFLVSFAQENSSEETEVLAVEPVVVDKSAEAFGIKTEGIPNPEDIIGDFVVGPGKFESQMQPGETKVVEVTVTNRTGVDRQFNIGVEDAAGGTDGKNAIILLGDDRGPYSIRDYISYPTNSFELKHGRRARVPVSITIPADAEPGGFYGSVLVNTVSIPNTEDEVSTAAKASSPVIQRIGILFFITVPGDALYEGELRDFSPVPAKKWYEKGPINFLITYENTGVVHLNPYGEIRITNMFNEEVGFVELEPWFAMPKSVRLREVTWNRDMLYGKYTATIFLNRGYDNVVDEMSYTFWVIPWKIVLGALGVLFIVFFLLRGFFRKFEFKVKTK